MRTVCVLSIVSLVFLLPVFAADNELTEKEKAEGWLLLFDGKSLDGWMNSKKKPGERAIEDGLLNPFHCGGYLLVHEKPWGDFMLTVDFKLSKGTNSGIFVRTAPLMPENDGKLWQNGLEIQLLDSTEAAYNSTGAIFDMVKPTKHTMKPVGEWNTMVIHCLGSKISVKLNGEWITHADLDEFNVPNQRPDGTRHKFAVDWSKHPRKGYLGFQDHGGEVWFKNVKLLPLGEDAKGDAG